MELPPLGAGSLAAASPSLACWVLGLLGLPLPASPSLACWGLGLLALPLPVFAAGAAGGWVSWPCRYLLLGVVSRVMRTTPLTPNSYSTRLAKKSLRCEKRCSPFLEETAEIIKWNLPFNVHDMHRGAHIDFLKMSRWCVLHVNIERRNPLNASTPLSKKGTNFFHRVVGFQSRVPTHWLAILIGVGCPCNGSPAFLPALPCIPAGPPAGRRASHPGWHSGLWPRHDRQ